MRVGARIEAGFPNSTITRVLQKVIRILPVPSQTEEEGGKELGKQTEREREIRNTTHTHLKTDMKLQADSPHSILKLSQRQISVSRSEPSGT